MKSKEGIKWNRKRREVFEGELSYVANSISTTTVAFTLIKSIMKLTTLIKTHSESTVPLLMDLGLKFCFYWSSTSHLLPGKKRLSILPSHLAFWGKKMS